MTEEYERPKLKLDYNWKELRKHYRFSDDESFKAEFDIYEEGGINVRFYMEFTVQDNLISTVYRMDARTFKAECEKAFSAFLLEGVDEMWKEMGI